MRLLDDARARLRQARGARPGLDHAFRAYDRHSEVLGGQIAAAISYFGFLAFFPVLALAFSVVGYVSTIYPQARDNITAAIEGAFPSLIGAGPGQLNIDQVVSAKAGAGVIGLIGLLIAGLGWLDALRDGVRRVFGTSKEPLSFVRKKLTDLAVLLGLGLALVVSLAVSSLAVTATTAVLDTVGLKGSVAATLFLKVLAVLLALAVDVLVFGVLLSRLPGGHASFRQVRSGALFAAIGFEILKLVGAFLIARTTNNPIYATFGVVIGLLVWINFVSRLLIYAAAWTATEAYSLEPGGLGSDGAGRSTGIAASTEPMTVVAPKDYEPVRVGATASSTAASSAASGTEPGGGRTFTVRGIVIGAALGAGLADLVSRRTRRDPA